MSNTPREQRNAPDGTPEHVGPEPTVPTMVHKRWDGQRWHVVPPDEIERRLARGERIRAWPARTETP